MECWVRSAKKEDIITIAKIEAVCFPQEEAASYDILLKRFEVFGEHFFVAETEAGMVGFINGNVTDQKTITDEMFEDSSIHNREGMYQSIFGLDVRPEYQGRGIGRLLMDHMIHQAQKQGRKGVILTCKQGLIPFYESFGYQNMGRSESVHGGAVWYDMILEF